jgi:iron complex outermembrane recepter protein
MKIRNMRRQLLGSTIVAGVAMLAAPAFAQDQDPTTGAMQPPAGAIESQAPIASADGDNERAQETGDVIVTGSRIRSPNLESASPVTVVNAQDVKLTGTTRTEDLLNSLPQVFAGQGSGVSNGSTGTATVNLRGLGAERNLVLVNGRRVVPGDPSSSAVDLNFIPAAVIKRVDLMSGGASAVYGADAVTGVVNFIMDTDFEGFRIDGQYSFFNHNNNNKKIRSALTAGNVDFPDGTVNDGGTVDATAVFGTSFDDGRGHITAYAGYRRVQAVTQANRDYSACATQSRSRSQVSGNGQLYNCSGSVTSAAGSFLIYDTEAYGEFTSTFFQPGANRTLELGTTPFNFNPANYYQRPDERYTAGFFANYEISDQIKPYAEFMFMDDRTVAQIAASGNFGNTNFINCDSPLLSPQQRGLICDRENLLVAPNPLTGQNVVGQFDGVNYLDSNPATFYDPLTGAAYQRGFVQVYRRNVEGGPRQDDLQHTSFRGVIGSRGDLGKGISYDAFYQYGRTIFAETYLNDFSVTRLGRALDVVTDPTTGAAVCRSVLTGIDPNCVPYDVFSGNPVSQAATNYLSTPGFQRGIVSEQVASASLSGSLGEYGIRTPWADEGVGIALGVEYRKERLEFKSDLAFQTGDLSGQGAPTLPVNGAFSVYEAYGELRVPIVHNSFIYDLSLTGGYRYSSYETSSNSSFNTDTYKIEGEFAPIQDVRFRGGYNRAVRAPTIQDLFAPNRVALDGSTDPCAGFEITAANQGCLLQGLRIGQSTPLNPASQYNGLIGGNANLRPEVADTYTAGVVIQPRFLPRFALTVDYFNIKIDGAVTTIGADTILAGCGDDNPNEALCSLINRDGSGSIWLSPNGYVTNLTQNIGGLSTKGIDVNASFSQPIGNAGTASLSFVGTWLDEIVTDTGVSGDFDCAGLYGNNCGTPNPEWRHTARLGFVTPGGLGASLRWRYFTKVRLDATSSNPNLENPAAVLPGNQRLPAMSYFDLTLTARIADNYNFRIGANNLFDKDPPITGSQTCPAGFCNGNTFSQVYDALGRYIFAGVTLDF